MPHSTKGSSDSTSTYSFDLLGPLNSSSTFLNKPGVSSSANSRSSLQFNARKRASLPTTPDVYTDLIGKQDIDEFLQKHLGDRNSMIANYNNSSKHRIHHYEEQFQYKENVSSNARERVQRESPVIAELRTNVIIKDEFTLVTDLSYHLAARYTRPDSAIMIKVDHSACLALGGTFDPCYILTITTVPSQMGPTMNKRNAALIQSFMADILSVPPERGIVKFQPIPEENFAINGTTMLGEIERQEKQQSNENGSAVRRAISSAGRKSIPTFKKSLPKLELETKAGDSKMTESKVVDSRLAEATLGFSLEQVSTGTRGITATETAPSAVLSSPVGIFELPAVEMERQRPSTAHSHTASTGSNGLRMNGVSDADLNPKQGIANSERPKTFTGGSASIQEHLKQIRKEKMKSQAVTALPPVRQSSMPPSKRERPPSFLKVDPSKMAHRSSRPTTPFKRSSQSSQASPDDKPRPRDSYIDGLMGTPTGMKQFGSEPTIFEKPSQEQVSEKKEPTANTARRRSTITATPKLPSPPPIPDNKEDSKSTKSLKVGKRKSFLAAFRRSTAAS